MLKISINIFFVLSLLCSSMIHAQNVNPSVSDPAELERIESEREQIFATLIEDPTNMDNLFKYANLSILIGDLEAAVKLGTDIRGRAALINSSRGVIYASNGADFADAAAREANKLRQSINEVLEADGKGWP